MNGTVGGHSFAYRSMRNWFGGLHGITSDELLCAVRLSSSSSSLGAAQLCVLRPQSTTSLDVVSLAGAHVAWFFGLPRYGRSFIRIIDKPGQME